jgi:hypothetical protein
LCRHSDITFAASQLNARTLGRAYTSTNELFVSAPKSLEARHEIKVAWLGALGQGAPEHVHVLGNEIAIDSSR